MRRVDAEGDSRGVRGQDTSGRARTKSKLRRASIESLERRELLSTSTSTLPTPTILTAPKLTTGPSAAAAAGALTSDPSASTPSVAVDPANPLKMVATWIDHTAAGYNPGGGFVAPITSYAQGAFSTNGGVTWTAFPSGFGPGSINVQEDPSIARPTNGQRNVYTQTTDASIGFDRNENVYVLTSSHDAATATGTSTAGVLDVQRFSFTGSSPQASGVVTPVYSWDQPDSTANSGTVDAAVTPVLGVDGNFGTFTDPTTGKTQTDPFAGNVYVAWSEIDSNTYNGIVGFNPDNIRMSASSNQAVSFTHDAYVDNSSNANNHINAIVTNPPSNTPLHDSIARYTAPQIAISQGSSTVAGGQVSIVYDDYGTQAPVDRILVQTDLLGGTSAQFNAGATTIDPSNGVSIPITVNITDPKFTTLQALDITTGIAYPTLADIGAQVVPPAAVNSYLSSLFGTAYPGFITLFNAGFGFGDGSANTPQNLGASAVTPAATPTFTPGLETTFDPEAIRSINDGNAGGTATAHFRATGETFIQALKGLGASVLNGTWTFNVGIVPGTTPDTSTAPKFVNNVNLNFSSGNNPGSVAGAAGGEVVVADKNSLFVVPVPGINPTNPSSANLPIVHTANQGSLFFDGKCRGPTSPATAPSSTRSRPCRSCRRRRSPRTTPWGRSARTRAGSISPSPGCSPTPRPATPTSSCRSPTTSARPGRRPRRSTTTTPPPTASAGPRPRRSTSTASRPSWAGPSTSRRWRSTSPPATSSSPSSTPGTTRPTPGWPPTSPPAATAGPPSPPRPTRTPAPWPPTRSPGTPR